MSTKSNRVSATAKSKGKPQKKDQRGESRSANSSPTKSRAQRDDTPEARVQQRGTPKTHPTTGRALSAARWDPAGTSA